MNYRELQQTTYEHGLSKNYLFEAIMIPRNKMAYDLKELSEKIIKHTKMGSRFKLGTNEKLKKLAEFLSPVKVEIIKNTKSESEKKLMSMSDISKKLSFDISVIYRIFKDYPNFTITKCQRRPSGMKVFNLHQIKDAFEIAINKNLVPSKLEMIKKTYEMLPDFSNLGLYPLTDKQLREVADKMNFPEIKQPESLIELQKETNNLLRQLLEIWRK
jgi:hypothetical protein